MEKTLEKSKNLKTGISIGKKDILSFGLSLLSFFFGRVVIFDSLNPVAIAFLSNFNFIGTKFYLISFFVLLGFLTKSGQIYFSKYVICIGLLSAINILFGKSSKKSNPILQSAVGSGAILISGLITAALNGFSFYYTVLSILETILTFSLSLVLKKGIGLFFFNQAKKIISNEEIFSLSLLIGSVIVGSADVHIGEFSLMYFFFMLSLLSISYKCGISIGATSAVLLSVVLILSGHCTVEILFISSVSAIFAGLTKELGKPLAVLSFIIFGGLTTFYIQPDMLSREYLYSAIGAASLFLILPNKLYVNIGSNIATTIKTTDEYINKVKEITNHRLNGFSNSFSRLAKTFNGLSEKKTSLDQDDVAKLIDNVAAKACIKCNMRSFCWDNNFYNTYQTIFSILASCEKKGKLDINDIPRDFKSSCINLGFFCDTTNRMFELYKTNLQWRNRIVDSRQLVGQQLMGVSEIINNLASELDFELGFKEDLGEKVFNELNKSNIASNDVIVMENKQGRLEVMMNIAPCYGKKNCSKEIIPLVNKVLNKKMSKDCFECIVTKNSKKSICKLKLIEEKKYRLTTAIAKASKTNSRESGDSHTVMELNNGSYLLALSDGMGSGAKAREESAASIELFEDFITAGFDKDMAINIINSVLVLKSDEESFSTMDICTIDLYTGICEFIKIGAASTYIIREDKIEVIKSSSLPVGILNTVDIDKNRKRLKDSDIIVMVTDGITDSKENEENKDNWITEMLNNFKSTNPQEIADYIITSAKNNTDGIVKDDMTVLTARLWECK